MIRIFKYGFDSPQFGILLFSIVKEEKSQARRLPDNNVYVSNLYGETPSRPVEERSGI